MTTDYQIYSHSSKCVKIQYAACQRDDFGLETEPYIAIRVGYADGKMSPWTNGDWIAEQVSTLREELLEKLDEKFVPNGVEEV